MLRVEELSSEEQRSAWDAYVAAQPRSEHYHRSLWQGVGQSAYGLRAPFLICRDERGAVRGVLPLFVVRRPLGTYLTSGLFGAYGPLLVEDDQARDALLGRARELAAQERARYLTLKQLGDAPPPPGFVARDTSVIATLALGDDPDRLWRGFRDKTRNAIRKAQRSDLSYHGDPADLPAFYDVLAENMHRKGTPIYGLAFLRELMAALTRDSSGGLAVLRHQGRVVSGGIVAYHRDRVYVPFASSRPSAFHMNPNNLLYWEIMQRAITRGARLIDFGRSPRDSSTLAFKLHFGAKTQPMPFHILPLRGEAPSMDSNAPTVQRLVNLWQRLPRRVADALGPIVCRHLLI